MTKPGNGTRSDDDDDNDDDDDYHYSYNFTSRMNTAKICRRKPFLKMLPKWTNKQTKQSGLI